jgi:hypothetical protein
MFALDIEEVNRRACFGGELSHVENTGITCELPHICAAFVAKEIVSVRETEAKRAEAEAKVAKGKETVKA